MEKAILKTLIYADIFDYPLQVFEIHKWLISKKINLRQVERALEKLYKVSSIKYKGGYYFLPKKESLVVKRIRKEKQSEKYFKKVQVLSQFLKLIPWIKLVGISGGLAVNNASKKDDIDLFIITGKGRLWICRLLILGLLSFLGQRRKKGESGRKIAGKLCINTLLEEDRLEQKNKDIFIAHELLQMRPLWQRDGVYGKYLEDNNWAFKFLPNWMSVEPARLAAKKGKDLTDSGFVPLIGNIIEGLAKKLQLKIMRQPQGMERIEDGAVYFHPNDCRLRVLGEFKKRISKFNIGTS